jgi:putative membrane protein
MTAWDLVMDPLMVAANHWVWEIDGAYFGVPLQNFLGWFLTALVILLLFLLITRMNPQISQGKESGNFNRMAISSYAILGGSTILLAFNNKLEGPALAGLFAMLPWILVAWWNNRSYDYAI